jgi:thiamine biosynthesis lipoprotein
LISRRGLFTLDFHRLRSAADPDRPRPAADEGWLRVHRTAMACRVEVTLAREDACHVGAASEALNEADRVEALLTVFRDSSELSRINREAARGCEAVDDEVLGLLQRCAQLHAETDGAFDVTSTPLSRCWGFLSREGRVPTGAEVDRARAAVGMSRVTFDGERGSVSFDGGGVELNLNAIGKGYALDRMARVLRRLGIDRALLSAGSSSVLAVGAPRGGWPVDLRSPLVAGRIARLRLRDGALGTSGAGEQFVMEDGRRYGHVIDPRTGWPARGVLSASVVTHDAAAADALSTAFLVGGPALAQRYCDRHPGTLALLTLDDDTGRAHVYGRYPGAIAED